MYDVESQYVVNANVRVPVGFNADDREIAPLGVAQKYSAEAADIKKLAAVDPETSDAVEKLHVLFVFPIRNYGLIGTARMKIEFEQRFPVIETQELGLRRPLRNKQQITSQTFLDSCRVPPPDRARAC